MSLSGGPVATGASAGGAEGGGAPCGICARPDAANAKDAAITSTAKTCFTGNLAKGRLSQQHHRSGSDAP